MKIGEGAVKINEEEYEKMSKVTGGNEINGGHYIIGCEECQIVFKNTDESRAHKEENPTHHICHWWCQ